MPKRVPREKSDPGQDPTLYRQMQQPHPSREAALAAFEGFFADVLEVRRKHRMTDVCLTVEWGYVDGEGETRLIQVANIGDQLKAEYLLAYALGRVQERREQIISRQISERLVT